MQNSKNQAKIIGIIVAVLVVIVAVFAYLNAGDVSYKKELEMNAIFELKVGEETAQITMDDMLSLDPVNIDAVMDTSNTDPTDVSFSGVELKKIFDFAGLEINSETIEVRSLDGYTSALTKEEIMQDDNVYICIAMGEEPLPPKSEGGMGPYLMIIKSSEFSQRWCKFVQEVVVQ